ncbi:hypothetical protein [Andreprevotia chitinilytica]|uniref:hypothetical protein n=1 Tax=Andreprevotia chitinilytica TaxID=396808 RepID=UPI00054FF6ED|nr:hypothetical protein [Andreprevotia chitinilytica]
MERVIELQHGPDHRLVRQLCTLAAEQTTLCSIIGFSPQTLVARAGWGGALNVLIVQEHSSYLLRGGRLSILRELTEMLIENGRPAFFLPRKTLPLTDWPAEDVARFLIAIPPVLLADSTVNRLLPAAQPMHGETIELLSPVQQPA